MMLWFWICAIGTRTYVWVAETPLDAVVRAVLALGIGFAFWVYGNDSVWSFCLGFATCAIGWARRPSFEHGEDDQ